jgi:isoleucyl-tRNA synthetase
MAPILSFTAEEAWQVFLHNPDRSIFEETLHQIPDAQMPQALLKSWEDVRQFREIVTPKIEAKRVAKELGSSLQAELDITASGATYDALARLEDDLRFVLITSRATLHRAEDAPISVDAQPSKAPKCDRCWHYRADVNGEGLCGRCVSNLRGPGEPRRHA